MADPYAERAGHPGLERLDPSGVLAERAREAGLCVPGSLADLPRPLDASALAVVIADDGLVPPLARISARLAVAMLAPAAGEGEAVPTVAALERAGASPFLLKSGLVAGPAGRAGAVELDPELVLAVLADARAERVEWERDPDFGYEVVSSAPALSGRSRPEVDAFLPRLVYAAEDRVYEHAELVELTKRRRRERLAAAGISDTALLAAVGWPIEPSGQAWKD